VKTILTLSGGLDSTVLLYHLQNQSHEVRCISVDYGQRHRRELRAAAEIAHRARVEHKVVDLSAIRGILAGSSQTSDIEVPEGHYEEESMKLTVVPNRNMILLALAGAWAVSTGSEAVAYAAHAGDHAIYPDCRPEFAQAMAVALGLCDWKPVQLIAPFAAEKRSKADLVKLGASLGVPFALTWSCYKGGEVHCGRCGTCQERREAHQLAGIPDPTIYGG